MITLLATLALLVEPAHWETAPDVKPADYPALARDLRINGTVTLECVNNEDGALSRCAAMSAKPADAGFQQAALAVVFRGRVAQPAGVPFTIELPFNILTEGDEPLRQPWEGPEPGAEHIRAAKAFTDSFYSGSRSPAERSIRDWKVDEMPPEKAALLRGWMAELYPDLEAEKAWQAAGIARVLALHGVDYLPTVKPIGWDVWYDQVSRASPEDPALIRNEMRRRYCAAFDCGAGSAVD
jgi:TonB family protein